ncbi:hypothetical protein CMV_027378 [Castanea mollissima]|uniref:Peptidase A1 domain-containing protein n=1 Tax=Castanea mollissima TaxID=60419 RepID=A0A8J4V9F6_9ROSI|nr:hypothetical protein CMV_027378 [Castanea mollissima]
MMDGEWIWKVATIPKIQCFIWQCLHRSIPVREVLHSRGMEVPQTCPICNEKPETILHCLRDCREAQALWKAFPPPLTASTFFGTSLMDWLKNNFLFRNAGLPWNLRAKVISRASEFTYLGTNMKFALPRIKIQGGGRVRSVGRVSRRRDHARRSRPARARPREIAPRSRPARARRREIAPRSRPARARRRAFGCGKNETGILLRGFAPNGLLGLGLYNISVPSTIARKAQGPNSFSMCFGSDGIGRINFGDNGTSDQKETSFTVEPSSPSYNISITQINVGVNVSKMEFNAIFDSGTSFTQLRDPVYTFISKTFNSKVTEKRHSSNSQIPFEYCYDWSANQTSYMIPTMNLTMKGGDQYYLTNPTVVFFTKGGNVYCLALLKSTNINIIGQNFMTGYHIVFNRDKMILGWKPSNCYNDSNLNTSPISPSHSPTASPSSPSLSPATSPALAVNPQAKAPSSHSPKLKAFTCTIMMIFVSFLAIV